MVVTSYFQPNSRRTHTRYIRYIGNSYVYVVGKKTAALRSVERSQSRLHHGRTERFFTASRIAGENRFRQRLQLCEPERPVIGQRGHRTVPKCGVPILQKEGDNADEVKITARPVCIKRGLPIYGGVSGGQTSATTVRRVRPLTHAALNRLQMPSRALTTKARRTLSKAQCGCYSCWLRRPNRSRRNTLKLARRSLSSTAQPGVFPAKQRSPSLTLKLAINNCERNNEPKKCGTSHSTRKNTPLVRMLYW